MRTEVVITICMSMSLRQRLPDLCRVLEQAGHEVLTPVDTREFDYERANDHERADLKRDKDLIRTHYEKIKVSDAILVLNEDLPGKLNYIGGNSFLEMGFAHVLNIPIYLMQDVPESPYRSEMLAMDPIVINGDLRRIPTDSSTEPSGGRRIASGSMRILIVGGGGREHALAWKLAQSPSCEAILAAPGNAGTAQLGQNLPIKDTDIDGLCAAAEEQRIDLVVIGPEAPLAAGLTDALMARGILAFGPSRAAAQIESSKWFAKSVMQAANVPHAGGELFESAQAAHKWLEIPGAARLAGAQGRRSRRRQGRDRPRSHRRCPCGDK